MNEDDQPRKQTKQHYYGVSNFFESSFQKNLLSL